MAFTILDGGSFTQGATAAGVKINLPSSADYFKTTNITQMGLTGTVCVAGEWFGPKFGSGASAANDGLRWRKAGSSAILIDKFSTATASDGFTYVTSSPVTEAPVTGFSSTAANPAVVTQTNTYSNGDLVRVLTATGDLTLGGMFFQISSVSGAGYTLLGLPATAANGYTAISAASTRRISKYAAVEPEFLYITNIRPASQLTTPGAANQAVVTVSVDPANYYAVGMKVHFVVPRSYGMFEISQMTGTILALNVGTGTNIGAYNFTVNIDVSAFTAFVFPATATSPTAALFATVAPAGAQTSVDPVTLVQTGYNFQFQPFRTGQFTPYMYIASGAASPGGAAGDTINWISYKLEK